MNTRYIGFWNNRDEIVIDKTIDNSDIIDILKKINEIFKKSYMHEVKYQATKSWMQRNLNINIDDYVFSCNKFKVEFTSYWGYHKSLLTGNETCGCDEYKIYDNDSNTIWKFPEGYTDYVINGVVVPDDFREFLKQIDDYVEKLVPSNYSGKVLGNDILLEIIIINDTMFDSIVKLNGSEFRINSTKETTCQRILNGLSGLSYSC